MLQWSCSTCPAQNLDAFVRERRRAESRERERDCGVVELAFEKFKSSTATRNRKKRSGSRIIFSCRRPTRRPYINHVVRHNIGLLLFRRECATYTAADPRAQAVLTSGEVFAYRVRCVRPLLSICRDDVSFECWSLSSVCFIVVVEFWHQRERKIESSHFKLMPIS